MSIPEINNCPGTLAEGYNTYSRTCLTRVFSGKKVSHILPYNSPAFDSDAIIFFEENRKHISISGVQEKYSVLLEKNKLRLVNQGERGTHILKPIPDIGKNAGQIPANEHLTMQIARQVFNIETAENALIFFKNGDPAYITKRFDIKADGSKIAQEDFASWAGRTPQTHGKHYKYLGNYAEMFSLMKEFVPACKSESPKLLKLLMFNYLFSNGDAHYKNFSLIETPMGDFKLSPAYDLLNSRIHIDDKDFALDDGLLPPNLSEGKIKHQFKTLSNLAGIDERVFDDLFSEMVNRSGFVEKLVFSSFLNESTRSNYYQSYQGRLTQLLRE